MEHFLKSLFDISKLPAKFFVLFSMVSGFVLFANPALLQVFHIRTIVVKYGMYAGIIFLVSTIMVGINTFLWIVRKNNQRISTIKRKKNIKQFIQSMTPAEKALIREFIIPNMRTIIAPLDDPTISGLLHRKFLYIAMSMGSGTMMQGSFISISICDDVHREIKFIDLGLSEPLTDNLEFINSNRPTWVTRYSRFEVIEN